MTKGQKNALERQIFSDRKKAITKYGYKVKSRNCGYGEQSVSLWKDGICIKDGYDYEFQVVNIAETLIKNNNDN